MVRLRRGRFDDATARVYRLIEWSSQWLLEYHQGIKTADVPESCIPPNLKHLLVGKSEPYKLSLVQGWELASSVCDEDTRMFWKRNRERMIKLISTRNNSVLAHGFAPISDSEWKEMESFVEEVLLEFILNQFVAVNFRGMPNQLPTAWGLNK